MWRSIENWKPLYYLYKSLALQTMWNRNPNFRLWFRLQHLKSFWRRLQVQSSAPAPQIWLTLDHFHQNFIRRPSLPQWRETTSSILLQEVLASTATLTAVEALTTEQYHRVCCICILVSIATKWPLFCASSQTPFYKSLAFNKTGTAVARQNAISWSGGIFRNSENFLRALIERCRCLSLAAFRALMKDRSVSRGRWSRLVTDHLLSVLYLIDSGLWRCLRLFAFLWLSRTAA